MMKMMYVFIKEDVFYVSYYISLGVINDKALWTNWIPKSEKLSVGIILNMYQD